MLKKKVSIFLIIVLSLLLVTPAFSQSAPPPIPQILFGKVKSSDGKSISSGKVRAYIENELEGEIDINSGAYEHLLVEGEKEDVGKPVTFKAVIGGVEIPASSQPNPVLFESAKTSGMDFPYVNLTVVQPPAAPSASPTPGTYTQTPNVTLSGESGVSIFYTTDNSDPTINGVEYKEPIAVTQSTTIKAVTKRNGTPSSIASFQYVIVTPATPVVSINVSQTSITMNLDTSKKLIVTTEPADATVTFESSNTGVVKVSSSGELQAVAAGSATITINATKTGYNTGTAKVNVTLAGIADPNVNATPSSVTLKVGETRQINASCDQDGATISYSSSKISVARVSSSGLITAVSNGDATITVTAIKSGRRGTDTVSVNVTDNPIRITVSPGSATLKVGEKKQLSANTTPSGATVTYSSSNTSVAAVTSSGLVTAMGQGTAVITARASKSGYDTAEDEMTVTVTASAPVIVPPPVPGGVPATPIQPGTGQANLPSFNDLNSSHWAYSVVSKLVQQKIVGGYPDSTFKPGNNISRAEFIKMLTKAINLPEQSGGSPLYNDVAPSDWYYGSIQAAAKAGLVKGYEMDLFKPNAKITRQEMAVMLVKAMGMEGAAAARANEETSFSDKANLASWARGFVAVAVQQNLVSGYPDNTFGPRNSATRAEACAMIFRLMEKR